MIAALALGFLSGFIALSYEILWYRALSFTSGSEANTFGLLLGAYLLGLALGALAVRRTCRDSDAAARAMQFASLVRLILFGNLFGFFAVPCLAWIVTRGLSWNYALFPIGVAAAGLGTVFPLISHLSIEPDDRVGRRVSYVYLANILGSTAGSLLTGFVLMDHLGLAAIHVLLAFLGLAMAAVPALLGPGPRAATLASIGLLALACAFFGKVPFDRTYEKLQLKDQYGDARRFKHVVETKSGVVTVNEIDQIFGGGIYDGAYNTGMRDDRNHVYRVYAAMTELHPAPREALMIGLSSGSWATIVANHPSLERLTVIEINPGYLQLLPKYPAVAGLLTNPKVKIEIDDGRRWLIRNKDRTYDAIVANHTFHWRSNATNLLSVEFLELIRSHLKPGGFYIYNTTGSGRVIRTGCAVFPHSLLISKFLAVSDSPIQVDLAHFREKLFDYPHEGRTVFDRNSPADLQILDRSLRMIGPQIRRRDQILADYPGDLKPITDDNLGTEFEPH